METLFQDIRFGLRALKRNLSLTIVVSITIALGSVQIQRRLAL